MAEDNKQPFHEEILLLAEKLGEVTDRLAKIETEHTAQTAPLDAAKGAQDSALKSLEAALVGIKALNFHVLDNNLGGVSARLSEVEKQTDAAIRALDSRLCETAKALQTLSGDTSRHLEAVNSQRVELERKRGEREQEFAAKVESVRGEVATVRTELADRIEAARKEFAEPKTFNPTGKYISGKLYSRLDLVEVNGSSFVSIEDKNDELPRKGSAKWQLLARRGVALGVPGANAEAAAAAAATSEGNAAASATNAATSASQAATITGSGSGAFGGTVALTGLTTLTGHTASNVSITAGSSGASLTLGQGASGNIVSGGAAAIVKPTANTAAQWWWSHQDGGDGNDVMQLGYNIGSAGGMNNVATDHAMALQLESNYPFDGKNQMEAHIRFSTPKSPGPYKSFQPFFSRFVKEDELIAGTLLAGERIELQTSGTGSWDGQSIATFRLSETNLFADAFTFKTAALDSIMLLNRTATTLYSDVISLQTSAAGGIATFRRGAVSTIDGGLFAVNGNAASIGGTPAALGVTLGYNYSGGNAEANLFFGTSLGTAQYLALAGSAAPTSHLLRVYGTGGVTIGGTTDPGAGNLSVAGSLKTGAPNTGTAGAWKLGIRVAATSALDTTQYLQVDVGGTLYKVALVTT